jgi:hypothetical protein
VVFYALRPDRIALIPTPFLAWPALELVGGHDASNAIETDSFALIAQVFTHTRRTNYATAIFVDLAYAGQNPFVLKRTATWRPRLPSIITTRGNVQAAAH